MDCQTFGTRFDFHGFSLSRDVVSVVVDVAENVSAEVRFVIKFLI